MSGWFILQYVQTFRSSLDGDGPRQLARFSQARSFAHDGWGSTAMPLSLRMKERPWHGLYEDGQKKGIDGPQLRTNSNSRGNIL